MEKLKDIVIIPDDTRYWLMRANSGEYYADFKMNNFIAIDGNLVALTQLIEIDKRQKENYKLLKTQYKDIFNTAYMTEIKEEKVTQHSISLRANQTFMFIEEMSINDIVLVPSQSSTHLLIGVIISDVTEEELDRSIIFDEDEFNLCEYNKKRRVLWLKEIQREELPNNMLGIINTHQGLLNLDHYDEQINSIISLLHYYQGNLFFTLRVKTLNPIDSITWLNFQQLIVNSAGERANEIFQKKSVESPGEIILETIADNWEAFVVIFAVFFGEVDYKGFRFRGLISRFFPNTRKNDELTLKQKQADIDKTTAETEKIKAEKEQIIANTQKIYSKETETVQQLEDSYSLNKKETGDLVDNSVFSYEQIKSVDKMELSNTEYGNEIPKKNQMDNLNL